MPTNPNSGILRSVLSYPRAKLNPCAQCRSKKVYESWIQPPQPIDEILRSHSIPDPLASRLSDTFMHKGLLLYQVTKQNLKDFVTVSPCVNECNGGPSLSPFPAMKDAVISKYQETLASWVKHCIAAATKKYNNVDRRQTRPQFNQDSTPFLEAYFELNPYPSAADRLRLAKQTRNTPKQIGDWFQNHRNRAKSAGKNVERTKRTDIPWVDVQEVLERKLAGYSIHIPDQNPRRTRLPILNPTPSPSPPQSPYSSSVLSPSPLRTPSLARSHSPEISQGKSPISYQGNTSPETNALSLESCLAPRHAYPASFPPADGCEPFPPAEQLNLPSIRWERNPATLKRRKSSQPCDIDSLVDKFQTQCHIREPVSSKRKRSESTVGDKPMRGATYFVIVPPVAPLPALVRSKDVYADSGTGSASRRSILPLPRRTGQTKFYQPLSLSSYSEVASSPSASDLPHSRRKFRRISSNLNQHVVPSSPTAPVQVLSLPNIVTGQPNSENVSSTHFTFCALKKLSRSFLDYASTQPLPFGCSFRQAC